MDKGRESKTKLRRRGYICLLNTNSLCVVLGDVVDVA